jgi:hypothetical protein
MLQISHAKTKSGSLSSNLTYLRLNMATKGVFTRNVKSVLSENLGGIWGGSQC